MDKDKGKKMSINDKLKAMREKLAQQNKGGEGGGGDGAIYPFWNIKQDPPNNTCSIRFLPDKDQDNPFFYREKMTYRWTFADPERPQQKLTVSFPCLEQWDGIKKCPILNELRSMYKSDEATAKKFWPKRSAIYQGFVRRSSIVEQNAPENRIRILLLNRELHEYIKASLLSQDPDTMFSDSPDDYEKGRDFIIRKTPNGQWSSYKTSQWANNQSSLTEDEHAVIAQFGLFDLNSKLPARPSDEAYATAMAMFEAGVDGRPWNPEWNAHFRAYSENGSGSRNSDAAEAQDVSEPQARTSSGPSAADRLKAAVKPAQVAQTLATGPVQQVTAPAAQTVAPASTGSSKDILAKLAALREGKKAS